MSEIEEGVRTGSAVESENFVPNSEIKEGEDQIHIRNLSKTYVTEDSETVVLEDFSLDIRKGELISIVGPSGCGKTTILRMLAGLIQPTSGKILIGDRECTTPGSDRGMVFQDFALFPWRSVRKNVEFGLEIAGMPKEQRRERADKYLKIVGLEKFADHRVHELSGGMKQRVALARALVTNPDVILMDEPFGALDAQTRNLMQAGLLKILDKTDQTIIFITQRIEDILPVFHQGMIVAHGRIVSAGEREEILDETHLSEAFGMPIKLFRNRAGRFWAFLE